MERNSIGNQYGGTNIDSSSLTGLAQMVSGVWSASSTLSTVFGGTGWNSLQTNSILLGNGSGRISTTTAGTDGYVLALSAGVPTWLATSTLSNITGTLAVAKGGRADFIRTRLAQFGRDDFVGKHKPDGELPNRHFNDGLHLSLRFHHGFDGKRFSLYRLSQRTASSQRRPCFRHHFCRLSIRRNGIDRRSVFSGKS